MGSSYDNAAAEALNKSYKRELVWRDGPWKGRDDLEAATARWVNWYNHTRPHLTNDDDLSPAAAEHRHHRNHTTTATTPGRLFWGVRVGLVGLLGRPGAGSCPNLPQRRPGPG